MEKQDKYTLFKNFMHNELGISKEDIHSWIREAVHEEALKMANNAFGTFDVKDIFVKCVESILVEQDTIYGERRLLSDLKKSVVDKIAKKITLKLNTEEES